MPDALAVMILSEFGGTRTAMIGNLLRQRCPDLVVVQSLSLRPAAEFPQMRALLLDIGVEHGLAPACLRDGDIEACDLILTLDEPSRSHVRRQREAAIQASSPDGPACLHWPGLEPTPNQGAFAQAWTALQGLVQDLMTRGVLKILAVRREATARQAVRMTSDVRAILPEPNQADAPPFHGLVARSAVMRDLFRSIRRAARTDYPVLIQGETGTGKELVAHAVHEESLRRPKAFVAVNCATLPENLAESELFGHVKGAFTGALKLRRGRFELADGGTLFLDEVGDLPPLLQTKLLRVLQERCFEPVGSERSVHVDVRVISATHRDLRQGVAEGWFREDLYYRLCVLPLQVPPLRERIEDIPAIVAQVLETIASDTGRHFHAVAPQSLEILKQYSWPGNVRELINTMQRAVVDSNGDDEILVTSPIPTTTPKSMRAATASKVGERPARGGRSKLDALSVQRALEKAAGNHSLAAELLGVGRTTLYRFLNRHGMR